MKNKLNIIIVDDEPLARRGLRARLQDDNEVCIIAECQNGREALSAIAEHAPDIVFLDIQMPGMSGFDVVHALPTNNMPCIIFVTAFDEFAVDAFKVNAIDYILKPIDDDRLQEALNRAKEKLSANDVAVEKTQLLNVIGAITGTKPSTVDEALTIEAQKKQSAHPKHISIRDNGETTLVAMADIKWVDAAGDYMCVHVGEDTHIMRTTMKKLEAMLNPELFQRIHRSTVVNLQCIQQVVTQLDQEPHVVLNSGQQLKMSRSYKTTLKKRLNETRLSPTTE